jgi:hypothetical protein
MLERLPDDLLINDGPILEDVVTITETYDGGEEGDISFGDDDDEPIFTSGLEFNDGIIALRLHA